MARNHLTDAPHRAFVAALSAPMRTNRQMVKPLEKDVQGQIRDFLKLHGWFVMRINSGMMKGEHKGKRRYVNFTDQPGVSDLMFAKGDRWGFCEVKRDAKAGASVKQMAFLADVRRRGGIAGVCSSIEDVKVLLGME